MAILGCTRRLFLAPVWIPVPAHLTFCLHSKPPTSYVHDGPTVDRRDFRSVLAVRIEDGVFGLIVFVKPVLIAVRYGL